MGSVFKASFSPEANLRRGTAISKGRKKISILSVSGLIFSDSIYFQSSWFKLFLYSHCRKTVTSRELRILSLLETSLGMGSEATQSNTTLNQGLLTFLLRVLSLPCNQSLQEAAAKVYPPACPQTCRHHCACINHYPYHSHGICAEQIRAWQEGWVPHTLSLVTKPILGWFWLSFPTDCHWNRSSVYSNTMNFVC